MDSWNEESRMGQPSAVYQVAEAAERENPESPLLEKGDEIIDMGDDFDFEGFQVVRREFFAHLTEPAVTFNNCRFYVNSACLNKFPDTDYVQVLVNRSTKILALRPCQENARDSFAWCSATKGKRKPKQTTCKLFFAKIVSMMEWNPDYRYKLLGKLIHANGQYMIAFDLTATEVYQRTFPKAPSRGLRERRCFLLAGRISSVCPTKSISSQCRSTSLMGMRYIPSKTLLHLMEPKTQHRIHLFRRLRWSSHPRRCSP